MRKTFSVGFGVWMGFMVWGVFLPFFFCLLLLLVGSTPTTPHHHQKKKKKKRTEMVSHLI